MVCIQITKGLPFMSQIVSVLFYVVLSCKLDFSAGWKCAIVVTCTLWVTGIPDPSLTIMRH